MHGLTEGAAPRSASLPLRGSGTRPWDGLALAARRLSVRWQGFALDARLARGEPADAEPRLEARAHWLLDRRRRRGTAAGWRRVAADARDGARASWTSTVQPPRSEVLIAEMAILTLTARLEGDSPVAPRGAALARHLLEDGCSPLYSPPEPGALREAVHDVLDALEGR
jgi:hypothetical protein